MFAKSTITIQLVLVSLLAVLAQARPTFVPNPAMNPEPFTFDAPAHGESAQVKAQADTPAQARNLGWHGRAAYNPFHPDNLRAAAMKGQQDQVRREVSGHAGLKKRGIRKISRKRACAAKTTAATTTGVASSTGLPVQSSASSAAASASTSASASLPIQNGAVIPTSTLVRPSSSQAASTQRPATSSSAPASSTQKTSTAAPVPTTSTTSSAAPATTSAASSGFRSVDPEGNGPFNGETTYYVLGTDGNAIGACGTNLVDSDLVSARTPS
jgi:hypothetical protein